jgi:predicted Zn-dependent protease
MSLVLEGSNQSVEQMIKSTRRGLLGQLLLVHPRGRSADAAQHRDDPRRPVPHRDGEIAGPVQNFRWNMSPLVGFNNVTGDRRERADAHG